MSCGILVIYPFIKSYEMDMVIVGIMVKIST